MEEESLERLLEDFVLRRSKEPVDYDYAENFMKERAMAIADGKEPQMIWLLEHSPLYTAGSSADEKDLLNHNKFPVYHTNRGGQYTYHGPGQRVVYIMLNIKKLHGGKPDIRRFIQQIQQWIILTLAHFGIEGNTRNELVGVWTPQGSRMRKVASIGVRASKWVSYHGVAINISTNLEHFSGIRPCGMDQGQMTSLEELGHNISMEEFDRVLERKFAEVFCKG